jgi:2-succinyl-5-enolpyruvyl-6-hydroxy-3-cyclohexene-1-carboxylate synthase
MTHSPSPVLGEVIVDQLIRSGVRDAVISPGSRNAPLTMALWRASELSRIRLHTRIDERSAAFLALGIAKATGLPTPVICTSGSAAANFYPALLEAHHGQHPLIAITADRPARLWQTGANQTTTQLGMFPAAIPYTVNISAAGSALGQVRSWRAEIAKSLASKNPAHINVEFDEPLVGPLEWSESLDVEIDPIDSPLFSPRQLQNYHPHGVILLGHDRAGIAPSDIAKLSDALGWPVLSEDPLLGVKVVPHSSLLLSDEQRRVELAPKVAMVVGRLTLTRAMNAYLALAEKVVVVDSRTEEIDVEREGDEIHLILPHMNTNSAYERDAIWAAKFFDYSKKISERLPDLLPIWSEPSAIVATLRELPSESALFVASSRPIRDIEAFAEPRGGIETFANRGLAGIDGNISTAFGIALSRNRTFAILGDLAFLHDINGLLISSEEVKPNLTIIVIANDGGGIFSTLPQQDVPGFEKIFGTPHGRDLVAIAESYGIPAVGVRTQEALIAQLARSGEGLRVIVANMPDRAANAELLKEVTRSLALL